jgi:hypothetical protein
MKRIISFLLITLIFIFLGLIIIQKYESKSLETFQSTEQAPTKTSKSNVNEVMESIEGGFIKLYNIRKQPNNFYYNPSDSCEIVSCSTSTDCNINQACNDIYGQNMCLNNFNSNSYILNSLNESYIELENNNINNFSFSFRFLLLNNENMQYIMSSYSQLWCLYVKDKNLYLRLNDNTVEKINNIQLICYEIYKLNINVSTDKIQININTRESTLEILLKPPSCQFDKDCYNETGKCVGSINNKKCKL